ncbi:MAG: hypothetical protein K8823_1530 [Cenarchaeum symbiont of Oopsacas minuta]|nr:hypothetical protein [Cenarchaeum symbiont of Oopsacas minuta]
MNRTQKTQKAWQGIPIIECKGKCHETCTTIRCSVDELYMIKQYCKLNGLKYVNVNKENNKMLTKMSYKQEITKNEIMCKYLKDETCTIYEVRPAICRLLGVVDKLQCEHECKIQGVIMTADQGHEIIGKGILQQEMPKIRGKKLEVMQ